MHSHDSHRHPENHSHSHAEDQGSVTALAAGGRRRERRLLVAFGLTVIMMIAEAIGGLISGSLALLADAGHMLVDAGALMFAWLGAHFARRPADRLRSFGYARLEVLVGYTNALTQMLLVAWIAFEAITRFLEPAPILSGTMLMVAIAGLVVNLIVLRVLGGHDHDDLNTAAARLHVIGDLLGSMGAVSAALVVRYLDWLWADPAVSILVSLLILSGAWRLLRRSAHILLEGVPDGVEAAIVASHLENQIEGVREIHHVHVWQLGGGRRVATLHARLHEGIVPDHAIHAIQSALNGQFGVTHATVQIEAEDGCQDDCAGASRRMQG